MSKTRKGDVEIEIAGSIPIMIRPFSFSSTGSAKYGMHIDSVKHRPYNSKSWIHCGGVISNKMILMLTGCLVAHMIIKPFLLVYYRVGRKYILKTRRNKS